MRFKLLFIILFSYILICGCATNNKIKLQTNYYPQCARPLERMREYDDRLLKNTAVGGLTGALSGAIIGFISTGNVAVALSGAAVGTFAGAGIAYTYTKMNQINDENARFASIRITANQDLTKANRIQLYCYESLECFIKEFSELQTSYESGHILKIEYEKRFIEIKKSMIELGKVIDNMDSQIKRTEDEFIKSITGTSKTNLYQVNTVQHPIIRVEKRQRQNTLRQLSSQFSQKRNKVKKLQEKNDQDLTDMLNDFSGKKSPPKQDPTVIKINYGVNYSEVKNEIDDLKQTHRIAIRIMNEAALEAGIDMV